MIKKLLLGTVLLGAAVGGPMAYHSGSSVFSDVRGRILAVVRPAEDRAAADPALPEAIPPAAAFPGEVPVHDLAEVLRFDVTVDWVSRRWPRVSTGLAELKLQGYRVTLVTGTTRSDLAGSLTYYFNCRHRVQKITFSGSTGDARKLVALLTTRYKFVRRLANDPGLAVYETVDSSGRRTGLAHIRSAGVLKASDPYHRFQVDLMIERPGQSS